MRTLFFMRPFLSRSSFRQHGRCGRRAKAHHRICDRSANVVYPGSGQQRVIRFLAAGVKQQAVPVIPGDAA